MIYCTETLLSYPEKGYELSTGGLRDIARIKDLDHQVYTCINIIKYVVYHYQSQNILE